MTLLGDAAHPMYPVGSNGASQAILDARCLADALARSEHPRQALMAYQQKRLPMTADIVHSNRRGGPEGVIDAVEQLAPDGFDNVENVLSYCPARSHRAGLRQQGRLCSGAGIDGGAGVTRAGWAASSLRARRFKLVVCKRLHRRPCESRDPYAVSLVVKKCCSPAFAPHLRPVVMGPCFRRDDG